MYKPANYSFYRKNKMLEAKKQRALASKAEIRAALLKESTPYLALGDVNNVSLDEADEDIAAKFGQSDMDKENRTAIYKNYSASDVQQNKPGMSTQPVDDMKTLLSFDALDADSTPTMLEPEALHSDSFTGEEKPSSSKKLELDMNFMGMCMPGSDDDADPPLFKTESAASYMNRKRRDMSPVKVVIESPRGSPFKKLPKKRVNLDGADNYLSWGYGGSVFMPPATALLA